MILLALFQLIEMLIRITDFFQFDDVCQRGTKLAILILAFYRDFEISYLWNKKQAWEGGLEAQMTKLTAAIQKLIVI